MDEFIDSFYNSTNQNILKISISISISISIFRCSFQTWTKEENQTKKPNQTNIHKRFKSNKTYCRQLRFQKFEISRVQYYENNDWFFLLQNWCQILLLTMCLKISECQKFCPKSQFIYFTKWFQLELRIVFLFSFYQKNIIRLKTYDIQYLISFLKLLITIYFENC